jgi:hypothetical protein
MTVCSGLRLIASIRTFVEVRLVCPEGCPTRPAREMNPEKAGTGRAWPALNFPSAPLRPQLRELAFVEMQSCPLSVLPGTGLARQGPPVSADTGRYHFLLGDTVMTEKFAPPEVTIRRYPASRICDVVVERAENNWSMCVLSAGAADANTAARAALNVKHALRHDYNLTTD